MRLLPAPEPFELTPSSARHLADGFDDLADRAEIDGDTAAEVAHDHAAQKWRSVQILPPIPADR